MKNLIKKIWHSICSPFIAMACFIDECKLANEDGEWDDYWEARNRREEKKR
jgi:hypothetical protein